MLLRYVRYALMGDPSGVSLGHDCVIGWRTGLALSRNRRLDSRDARWYEDERHANQRRNTMLFDTPGWYYCDSDSFYRAMFPEGFLQSKEGEHDGKPNAIVIEDTGRESEYEDRNGSIRSRRLIHRYTIHDDLDLLEKLRDISIEKNTFMFLSPISYYGKSRSARNARFLHAFMIDLDYVGERELANLLHQMERGVIPYANYLVSSGTGLHVVYMLKNPIPLMTRYIAGLQAIKEALTDMVWNANTSASDPDKKQHQGIYQGFRMVGTPTKLNGEIGNPKLKQPYVVEAFSHDSTPRATVSYLLSFLPKLKDMAGMDDLVAVSEISRGARRRTPIEEAKELWPDWYERRVVNNEPRSGFLFPRSAYEHCLEIIKDQVSVSHRYWCIFYLAVMANKCGISYEELEEDAYGLVKRFDDLSVDPSNRFTERDVAAALEAYEGGSASGKSRRYTKAFCERHAAVSWGENAGVRKNPPEKRLPLKDSLAVARLTRDLNQQRAGTNWWDNGNRDGAPKKAMRVWAVAIEHPGMSHSAIAREAGVSRPTVIKWLGVEGWQREYRVALEVSRLKERRDQKPTETNIPKATLERASMIQERYADDRAGLEKRVIRYVASRPWKSFAEVAVYMGLSGADEVDRIVRENMDLYRSTVMGLAQKLGATVEVWPTSQPVSGH